MPRFLAGGQSLVAAMNFRLARPSMLIDANHLPDLSTVTIDGNHLVIGALTRHAMFHKPVVDHPIGHLLSRVVRFIAHYPIRQRGTFGGSLCHADPASEWCLVASVLDAEMMIESRAGKRRVPAGEFFRGTFTTALKPNELLTHIRLPLGGPASREDFMNSPGGQGTSLLRWRWLHSNATVRASRRPASALAGWLIDR